MEGSFGVCVYPWDILDESGGSFCSTVRNRLRLDTIYLAATYHAVTAWRPRGPREKLYHSERAWAYFRPRPRYYRDTPVHPVASPLARQTDPLSSVLKAARRTGLRVILWTVCTHSTTLGLRHPALVQRNVYGDPYPHALCPGQEAVQAYVAGLVADLSDRPGVAGIELEHLGFGSSSHYLRTHHSKMAIEFGPVEETLLSWCFCRACTRRARKAGVDTQEVRQKVRALVDPLWKTGQLNSVSLDVLLSQEPVLKAYARVREATVTECLEHVAARCRVPLGYLVLFDRWVSGADLPSMTEHCASVSLLGYTPDEGELARRIEQTQQTSHLPPKQIRVYLEGGLPSSRDTGDLQRNVQRAWNMGIREMVFYNYGLLTTAQLDGIAMVVESVRRASPRLSFQQDTDPQHRQ